MDYQIIEKDDINLGMVLTVRIPEEQLDKSALYTMEEDMPPFVIPFTYRNIDGEVEISYQLGSWSPLRYFRSVKTVSEYCALFRKILLPLQNCDDWFMNPFNFFLSADRVYYNPDKQNVAYLYLPAVNPCADREQLVSMVKQLNKLFPANNDRFRVEVLECMDVFSLRAFLDLLKGETDTYPEPKRPAQDPPVPVREPVKREEQPLESQDDIPVTGDEDDLDINWPGSGKSAKPKTAKAESGKNGGFFGLFGKKEKKRDKKQEAGGIMQGAAIETPGPVKPQRYYAEPDDPGTRIQGMESGITQIQGSYIKNPRLVRVGDPSLPGEIRIQVSEENVFKIGRYDVVVGRKQSDFEFPASTREVSRHHAVIEMIDGMYRIVDINSKAGTKLDGRQIRPNVPQPLRDGMKVSFGNAGADYVFHL